MSNVTIRVNVLNEMKKLKDTAYGDRLSWIDELIQNTQRAKAHNVRFIVTYDKVSVEDDGVGCTDPQVLFEKSTSGWGSSTDGQNPFGEGFFSTMMIANKITVRSVGFEAEFDVKKMFQEQTMDCITTKGSARRSGFMVELEDLESDYSKYDTEERILEVSKYIKSMNVYLNGERLDKVDFTDFGDKKYAKKIEERDIEGWIAPFKWGYGEDGYLGDGFKVFAQERLVKEENKNGIVGVIHVKNNIVDLRSPDRKDMIYNNKYTMFRDKMDKEVSAMYLEMIKFAGDGDIDKYADIIDRYVPVEDYKKYVKFLFATDFGQLKEILEQMGVMEKEGVQKINFTEVAKKVAIESKVTEENLGEVELVNEHKVATVERAYRTKIEERQERTGRTLGDVQVFYVGSKEVKDYKDNLGLAQYHGVPVIIYRNNLEKKVLEATPNAVHISHLHENVELSAKIKRVGAVDGTEERAMWIFSVISQGLGFGNNIFKIGDMTTTKETRIGSVEIVTEVIPALALAKGGEIFIDRKALSKEKLVANQSKRLNNEDRAFICRNMETIAHELAHVMYLTSDNTIGHSDAQVMITNTILKGLF